MKKYWLVILALVIGALSGTFSNPLMSAAFAADVQLGAGDVIRISVYDHPDLLLETRVSEAGSISFPLIGEVQVGGVSSSVVEKKIASLLEAGSFIHNAQVNVIVTLMQSQQVSVLGQVNRPGRYPIDGQRSLTDILALAGGGNADAGDTVTLIRTRNGKTEKEVIDLIEMVRTGDMKQNQGLIGGDVIYVERAPRFYIYGEVQRPGTYRLERNMTVLQALSVGGGLSQRGTARNVRLKRRDEKGVLQEIVAKHDDLVGSDDVLYVRESLF
ncbi:polysaccharide export protein EpsE [Glaciimonas sp. Gout2]|uniref:polysaccharide export protein EpsE n=1 Tax=unclassified Glaciimonas TaxID=2644401 RepID=UPI002B222E96|nr:MULTISPECIES: polysaccharide export protein EpsE [unclassified Glaciimonas]MEB0010047.1 polysaccharide export protein EpsE [Glaciimonas sp. Cout2]MEB0081838.1 polysaccharide export protein EpsE [Glaciimonas sp. Gout2]